MKVLVLTEGGKNFGFGHLTRCAAFLQCMREENNSLEYEFLALGDVSAEKFMKINHINLQSINWQNHEKKILKLAKENDITIMDSYTAKKKIYDKISDISDGNLVMLDDYNRIEYPKGIVVNPSIYGEKLEYKSKEGAIHLGGKEYVILRKEFCKPMKKNIRREIKDVLITFGGKEYAVFLNDLINSFSEEPSLIFHVVTPETVQKTISEGNRVKFYSKLSSKQMLNLMLKCDLCISGGGQTLHELARCGVPTIGICFAENQEMNLRALKKRGFLEYIGWYNQSIIFKKLHNAIQTLRGQEARGQRSSIGKKLIDGKGAKRIIRSVLKHKATSMTLRRAGQKDCKDLWVWRNDPQISKWCRAVKKIKYTDHKAWFSNMLEDKKVFLYIAEHSKSGKIGQSRFESKKNTAMISVNLNPSFIGGGLGVKIIDKSTTVFMKNNPRIKEVIAEIKENNIASKKAFEKAGYKFSNYVKNGNNKLTVYKFRKNEK